MSADEDVTVRAHQAILKQATDLVGATDGRTLRELTMAVLALSRMSPTGVDAPLAALVQRASSLGQTADAENLRHIAEALIAIHEYRRGVAPTPTSIGDAR